MTSLITRSVTAKASESRRRSASVSVLVVRTMSRSSSWLTSSPGSFGSTPSTRTTALVERESSQISGRVRVASRSSSGAATSATRSGCCRARRLGTSSPATSDRYDTSAVTTSSATVAASATGRPQPASTGSSRVAIVAPP